jgi:hypothetical protein
LWDRPLGRFLGFGVVWVVVWGAAGMALDAVQKQHRPLVVAGALSVAWFSGAFLVYDAVRFLLWRRRGD